MIYLKRIIEQSLIKEGLIITTHPQRVVLYLTDWFSNEKNDFTVADVGIIQWRVKKDEIRKKIENIIVILNNFGWYISSYRNVFDFRNSVEFKNVDSIMNALLESSVGLSIYARPKFDVELAESALPDKAYHITPLRFKDKILKIGLVPRTKNKIGAHPERVYLVYKLEDLQMLISSDKFYPGEVDFIIFEIDVKGLISRRKVTFLEDSAFPNKAFYTHENIPPNFILGLYAVSKDL